MTVEPWNDLRAFLRFAEEKLKSGPENLTLDDVLAYWESKTVFDDEPDTLRAIQDGLDDMYAGRTIPAEEAAGAFRKKHNI